MSFEIYGTRLKKYNGDDETVAVPDGITVIGSYAFSTPAITESYPLKRVILPEGITEIGSDAFSFCKCLEEINLPSTLKVIKSGAFFGCSSLKKIVLPEGLEELGAGAFNLCMALTSVRVPPKIKALWGNVFGSCKALTSVELCEGLEIIDRDAFNYCKALPSVTIPQSVKKISIDAFRGCDKLLEQEHKDPRIPDAVFATYVPLKHGERGMKLERRAYTAEEAMVIREEADSYEIEYSGDPQTRFGNVFVSTSESCMVVKDGHFFGYSTICYIIYDGRPSSERVFLGLDQKAAIIANHDDSSPNGVRIAALKKKR